MTSQEPLPIQDRIQLEAYLLSERAGHPAGLDKFFWTQAEAIVHGRVATVVPAGKTRVARKAVPARRPAAPKAAAAPKARPAARRKK